MTSNKVKIEEGISINLQTLLKNGFYAKRNGDIYHVDPGDFVVTFGEDFVVIQELYFEDLDYVLDTTGEKWYLEDHGITWSLDKNDLIKRNNKGVRK